MSSEMLENVTFEEIEIGQSAEIERTLTQKEIRLFAAVSGDVNPTHLDEEYAENSRFHGIVGHSMWSGGLISTVLGTELPGPGTGYLEQDIKFVQPIKIDDIVTAKVTVKKKKKKDRIVILDCVCTNEKGEILAEGTATVQAPIRKMKMLRPDTPLINVHDKDHYEDTLAKSRDMAPLRVGIVHPVGKSSIEAAADAASEELIIPVLIGPADRIKKAIEESEIDASGWEIVDAEHSHAAAVKAASMAATGEVDSLMKGSLHTDELLSAVLSSKSGLKTERRVSHVYLMNVPTYHKPLMITDAVTNIAPDLNTKVDICQNAIDLWHVLFNDKQRNPKVAILSAVETVTNRMMSTIDAASLCKMSDRGQITGGDLDGPLAFDNAISAQAVKDKNIISDVAGDADILLCPNIEAANSLAKQLIFLGDADAAGIVLGTRVPIILTSRADSVKTRLLSCAVAKAVAHARKEGQIK